MKTISYAPSKDELVLKLGPTRGKPAKRFGRIKLWWDAEGNIRGIQIRPYMEEQKEFTRNLSTIRLGGIWKGLKVTAKDLKETRAELLRRLEVNW